jgi:hypothetical protein
MVFSMPHTATHRIRAHSIQQDHLAKHMLALPKTRPGFSKWMAFVVFTGVLIAISLIAIIDLLSQF